VIGGVTFFALGGFARDFRVPLDFSQDTLVFLAQGKSTFDNGWWWVNPRQGAPFRLNALLWPSNTNVDQAVVWLLSRFLNSPTLTINAAWLLMLLLSGFAATYGLRSLGFSRVTSLVAGTLFALSPYALYRHLGHFSLVTYLVPFPATVAVQLASSRVPWNTKTSVPLLAGCALLGFNYVYYAFFGCFFIALGAVAGFCLSRDARVLRAGGVALATISLCVVLNFLPSLYAASQEGEPLVVREKVAAEAEVYGLKIRQLVSPVFQHTFMPFRVWTEKEAAAQFPLETENMISRLGLVGSLGFIGLLGAVLFYMPAAPQIASPVMGASRLTVAGLLLSTLGGFGSLFNLLVTPDIRAYNRVCPFIAFFALIAVAAAIDSVLSRRRRSGMALAGIVLTVGLWDQAHALHSLEPSKAGIQAEYRSLQAFVSRLEDIAPDGAMVLQLPFTIYLNDGGQGHARMRPYDHFKPYLVSRDLKWSYPALSNAQFAWQEGASQLEPVDLASLAATEGFRIILVDRYGYADGATALTTALKSIPGVRILAESERYAAIDISGIARPATVAGKLVQEYRSDAPTTPSLAPCAGAPIFSVDRIGKATAPFGAAPIEVSRSNDLAVSGWAVTPEGNKAGGDVELALDTTAFATAYGFERPDVAAYFKTPESDPSGFRARIPSSELKPGSHALSVRVLSRSGACFFQSPGVSIVVK